MNTELFIARKLFFDKTNKQLLSQKIIRISLYGIALSFAIMLISVSVVIGFKNEIRNKIIGFGSHIQIVNFDTNNSYELSPISQNQSFLPKLKEINGVENIQVYGTKPGMIKTDEYIQGIVLKGVDENYNWDFFRNNLVEGRLPEINSITRVRDIILSEQVAKLLKLKLDDSAVFYFIHEDEITPRMLQLKVCGIYRTGLEEFDNIFVFGDIKQIRRLNDWDDDQVSGFEIEVSDFNHLEDIHQDVRNTVIEYKEENDTILRTNSITRLYPQIFDWLAILDMNVWVLLILLVLVAGFNMISGLLVLILERSTMIGVLKALGSPNWNIRKVFLYLSFFLTGRGMLWGNILGISIIVIQKTFNIITLDPKSYYVDFVPMNFSVSHILILNIASILVTTLMLLIPSYLVSKISPDKTIRFD
jgi:lipoprotein-releasing system permease protein